MDATPGRQHHTLLETPQPGELRVAYDGTGLAPVVTLDNPDGSIELRGAREIHAATLALLHGAQLADEFDLQRRRQVYAQ